MTAGIRTSSRTEKATGRAIEERKEIRETGKAVAKEERRKTKTVEKEESGKKSGIVHIVTRKGMMRGNAERSRRTRRPRGKQRLAVPRP